MKITAVYGNMRHGSTWNFTQLLLGEMAKRTATEVTEFSLPRDMPHFCVGCFNCFLKGEEQCPHYAAMSPIAKALEGADVIILASPAYVFDASGQMKALLDHLGYRWIVHRAHPTMFQKLGVAVSTTAGAGASAAAKTMQTSMKFWGCRRVYALKAAVAAAAWDEVKPEKQEQLTKKAATLAKRLVQLSPKAARLPVRLHTRFFFALTKLLHKKTMNTVPDKAHWEALGWENGIKPWKKQN